MISSVSILYLIPESLWKVFICLFSYFLKKLSKFCGVKSSDSGSSDSETESSEAESSEAESSEAESLLPIPLSILFTKSLT